MADQEKHASVRPDFQVVAAVLTHQGRICLLRRSAQVSSEADLWRVPAGGGLPDAAVRRRCCRDVERLQNRLAAGTERDRVAQVQSEAGQVAVRRR